mgnify:CR=1 FL=1
MEKTLIYTKFVNDKGVNDLIVVFDNFGCIGKSHKSPQAAYKNYLRNRTRKNKKLFLKDVKK